jgi:hypothetical protein
MPSPVRLGMLSLAVAATCSWTAPAAAQWCPEPSKPFCLSFGRFDESCRWSVDDYARQLAQYKVCLDNEARMKVLEARRRAEQEAGRSKCGGLSLIC